MSGQSAKKDIIRDLIILGVILIIAIVSTAIFPAKRGPVLSASWEFFLEMIWILPAVMILTGLFMVWTSKEMVVKYLGKSSGVKGILLAFLLGSLPTGPLYVAFPIAAAMLQKGAKVSSIVIFLSAWACIKIPQEMVELQFLGLKFMGTRLILTVTSVIIMAFVIDRLITPEDEKKYSMKGKTMKTFDLKEMTAFPYAEREKNVFYKEDEFKARIIELPPGGEMPTCEMASHVVFFVVEGSAEVNVDGEVSKISNGQLLVTPPATLSMKTAGGVKIAAIQIEKQRE